MRIKICLVVCPHLRQEFERIVRLAGMPSVTVDSLPCRCHQGGQQGELLESPKLKTLMNSGEVHVISCPGLQVDNNAKESMSGSKVITHQQDNSFEWFISKDTLGNHLSNGAYMVTPGWVEQWPQHIAEWGFDQETAREFFTEFARRVVMLDTGVVPEAARHCAEFAGHINFPWSIDHVGLDHCAAKLKNIILARELAEVESETERLSVALAQRDADLAAVFDLLAELTAEHEERVVVDKICELFTLFFSPNRMGVGSVLNGEIRFEASHATTSDGSESLSDILAAMDGQYMLLSGGQGFAVRFGKKGATNGLAVVSELAFPKDRLAYLNQAINMAPVCCLAIANSRALRGIMPICSFCKKIQEPGGRWRQIESYISEHSSALFSHTYCEVCVRVNYRKLMEGEAGSVD